MLTTRDKNGQRLPASVLETWLDLRGLAWGAAQTPPLDFGDLHEWLGKSRSVVCRHLATLRQWFGQRWEIKQQRLVVYFDDNGEAGAPADRVPESGLVPKVGPATAQEVLENKASPKNGTPAVPSLKDSVLKESSSIKNRGRGVPKSGLVPKVGLPDGAGAVDVPPAIEAYRVACRRYPDKATWPTIVAAVGAEAPNLARWTKSVEGWVLCGHNKTNVAGMLDWYRKGQTTDARNSQEKPNGPKRPDPKDGRPAEPLSDAQRIARQLGGE